MDATSAIYEYYDPVLDPTSYVVSYYSSINPYLKQQQKHVSCIWQS